MKGYIYKYTFPNGKIYIGQTRRDPKIRHSEHICAATGHTNSALWSAFQEFKDDYQFEVVKEIEAPDAESLSASLNVLESSLIVATRSSEPDYGYNIRMFGSAHTNYLTRADKLIREKVELMRHDFFEEKKSILYSVQEKIFDTKEPFTEEERTFVVERCMNHEFWPFPKSFDIDNLKKNKIEYSEIEFKIEECLDCVKFDLEEEADEEFHAFLEENKNAIVWEVLSDNAIVALDDDGAIKLQFYSFQEIADFFHAKTATNVRNVLEGRQKTAYGYHWKYQREIS